MKYASILLLAGSVARQTIQSAIVHFRERSVREDALAVPSGVLVTRLGQFDHLLAIVEDPPKAFGRWIRLDPADHPGVLVTCHSIYALLFGHADWLVCEKKNQTPASQYFFSSDIFSLSSFPFFLVILCVFLSFSHRLLFFLLSDTTMYCPWKRAERKIETRYVKEGPLRVQFTRIY